MSEKKKESEKPTNRNLLELILLLNLLILSTVETLQTKELFALTNPDYIGAVTDGYADIYLLQQVQIQTQTCRDYAYGAVECNRYCIMNSNCKSFVLNNITGMCYITSYDRCEIPSAKIRRIPEFTTYEMRQTNDSQAFISCFNQCKALGNCSACGRSYCYGPNCDMCLISCWDIPPFQGLATFWVTLRSENLAICDYQWQLIFSLSAFNLWPYLYQNPLWLRLNVMLSNGTSYTSYFDNFIYNGLTVEVGKYLGGSAGNDWGAPFSSRPMSNLVKSNCYNFFYNNSMEGCNIPQIMSYENQSAHNIPYANMAKGYIWNICKVTTNATYVLDIQFYVSPQVNSSINDPSFLKNLLPVIC